MEVRVAGHQVETGEALRSRVSERISALAERYFSRAIGANVTFGRGPHDHGFTCDIVAILYPRPPGICGLLYTLLWSGLVPTR